MSAEPKCELDSDYKGTQCHLDKRARIIWFLPTIVFNILIWVIFFAFIFPTDSWAQYVAPLLVLSVVSIAATYLWTELKYREYTYTFGEKELVVKEGLIHRKHNALPYHKIQNVHIEKPPLYRLLGLSILKIETASAYRGEAGMEAHIPGVRNGEEVAKQILSRTGRAAEDMGTQSSGLESILKELDTMKTELASMKASRLKYPDGEVITAGKTEDVMLREIASLKTEVAELKKKQSNWLNEYLND